MRTPHTINHAHTTHNKPCTHRTTRTDRHTVCIHARMQRSPQPVTCLRRHRRFSAACVLAPLSPPHTHSTPTAADVPLSPSPPPPTGVDMPAPLSPPQLTAADVPLSPPPPAAVHMSSPLSPPQPTAADVPLSPSPPPPESVDMPAPQSPPQIVASDVPAPPLLPPLRRSA